MFELPGRFTAAAVNEALRAQGWDAEIARERGERYYSIEWYDRKGHSYAVTRTPYTTPRQLAYAFKAGEFSCPV